MVRFWVFFEGTDNGILTQTECREWKRAMKDDSDVLVTALGRMKLLLTQMICLLRYTVWRGNVF